MPIRWSPPEVLVNGLFSSASDVWSFGVVLWEIFTHGMDPFGALTGTQVAKYVTNGQRLSKPDRCDDNVYQIMRDCWHVTPWLRPTFIKLNDLLKSVKFNGIPDNQSDSLLSSSNHKNNSSKSSKSDQAITSEHISITHTKSQKNSVTNNDGVLSSKSGSSGSGNNPSKNHAPEDMSPSPLSTQSKIDCYAVANVYLRTRTHSALETDV